MARKIQSWWWRSGWKKVTTMARSIPAMAMKVPDLADFGLERPLRARMKVTAAIR
jgi:hypothetical protein